MPFGYLFTSVAAAACTTCAVSSSADRVLPGTFVFRLAMLVNELPCIAVYVLVLSTALAAAQGDLADPVGVAGLAVTVLTLCGLAILGWRAGRTGCVVNRALDVGLGASWRTAAPSRSGGVPRRRLTVNRVLFLPARARRRDVERVADLAYGPAGSSHLLDVYRHRSRPAGCPVLVHLHGGRLAAGRKNREGLPLLYHFASHGWLCISANYRVGPAARFPDHLVDVKRVLAWVRAEGERYGADPSAVVVSGGSSGAHLASLAALTIGDPRYQPGFETADTSVLAAVAFYGLYDGRAGVEASPMSHVSEGAPPLFVAHGDHDTVLPVEGARAFTRELRRVSHAPVVYAELPGGQHVFDMFRSVRCDHVVDAVESFASWVRASPDPAEGSSPRR